MRSKARELPSRYLALVLDALVLAAFGEWASAASMARRAIERAEYFSSNSPTRKTFDQFGRSDEGQILHGQLLTDIEDVDGREARYICAHAIRYSARSLRDFEEAAQHLRVFREVAKGDPRAQSEDLALSLAEWTYLKYVNHQTNIGRLRSLRERLEKVHIDLDGQLRLNSKTLLDSVSRATVQYVWEQSTLNLAVVLIELSMHNEPVESGPVRASQLAESLAFRIFEEASTTSQFARFISLVTCLLFARRAAATLCKAPLDQLLERVEKYAGSVPVDGVVYERARAKVYAERVLSCGAA